MHLDFLEKVLEDGNYEISIVGGVEELEEAIKGEFVTPKKMILTAEQKKENAGGLRDLLSGAFCFQEIQCVTFAVKNEDGERLYEYTKSLYEGLDAAVAFPGAEGGGQGGPGEGGGHGGGHGEGGEGGDGGCCGGGHHA